MRFGHVVLGFLLLSAATGAAQQYVISTIAEVFRRLLRPLDEAWYSGPSLDLQRTLWEMFISPARIILLAPI
jgi:hypothetical protein